MRNEPSDKELIKLPQLYRTERVPTDDKLILMHFYFSWNQDRNDPSGCHWWAAEYGPDKRISFGYALLNGDWQMSEWGYVSYDELREIEVEGIQVDRDTIWTPQPFGEIELIKQCLGG